MRSLLFYLLVTISTTPINCQESAQYLNNAVRDLRNLNVQTLRRADTALVAASASLPPAEAAAAASPPLERRVHQQNNGVPPLSLTKGELAALYEAAIAKGETIKLDSGDSSYVHAAVHELDGSESQLHDAEHVVDGTADTSGYYYYYYPIKSFLDEMTSQPSQHYDNKFSHPPDHHETFHPPTHKPQYQYHSHTHQHNVNITSMKGMVDDKKPKALEPLFMAISGFIGMAVMFVLSVIVLPRFGINKFKASGKKNERIGDMARIALQAIEGGACAERFACELGKTARSFNLQENRFVKLIKRIAPFSFGKQIDRVGRYSNKRIKCTAIPCKKKNPNTQKKKPGQKKP